MLTGLHMQAFFVFIFDIKFEIRASAATFATILLLGQLDTRDLFRL